MLLGHSYQPPYLAENSKMQHQTPQTGEKLKLMNSSSPKRGSYCSLLTELNKHFFSLLQTVSRANNNGKNNTTTTTTQTLYRSKSSIPQTKTHKPKKKKKKKIKGLKREIRKLFQN
jgi:hypothetical protein